MQDVWFPSRLRHFGLAIPWILLPALLAAGFIAEAGPVSAAEGLKFAIVAPIAGSPFFEAVEAGCSVRAAELTSENRAITCAYMVPEIAGATNAASSGATGSEHPAEPPERADQQKPADQRNEAQIILDLMKSNIDGIAVAPNSDPAVGNAIRAAVKAGIPVVTYDSDAAASARGAFIGTNARDFGRALGASLKRWKPSGGKYAIVSTDPTQPNIAERIFGVRDALGANWSEIMESPSVTTGDYADAVSKIDHLLNTYSDVDAIISVGAWPMLATSDWRDMVGRYKARIDKADLVLVVADALPSQKELVRQGFGHVLVGQKPADMGARAVDLLLALKAGRKVPEVVYVGFETFTRLDLVGQTN